MHGELDIDGIVVEGVVGLVSQGGVEHLQGGILRRKVNMDSSYLSKSVSAK